MRGDKSTWEAAGFVGMSEQMVRDVYGHHHPDFMKGAVIELQRPRRDRLPPRRPVQALPPPSAVEATDLPLR